MSFDKWLQDWRISNHGLRLGQAFCNDFMGSTVATQIYYEEDYWKAMELIQSWLIDNCHYPNVPEKIIK